MRFHAHAPLGVLILAVALTAASLPSDKPEAVGLSSERLQRINQVIQRYIDGGEITGAITMVSRRGKVAHFEAQGLMDLEKKTPMREGRHLPHRVDVEADHGRRHPDADGGRQAAADRSGVAIHSGVQGHEGRDREDARRGPRRNGQPRARGGGLHGAGRRARSRFAIC